MKGKISFDWTYQVGTIVTLFLGIWILSIADKVQTQIDLVAVGLWMIALSVIAFFIGNIYYTIESSEPKNFVNVKLSKKSEG